LLARLLLPVVLLILAALSGSLYLIKDEKAEGIRYDEQLQEVRVLLAPALGSQPEGVHHH
jgi:hypothetical protein